MPRQTKDKDLTFNQRKRGASLTEEEIKAQLLAKRDKIESKLDRLQRERDDDSIQMLKSLRVMYRTKESKDRLKRLLDQDDRQFVAMYKELLKGEIAVLGAKSKQPNIGNQVTYVVIKGLGDDKKFEQMEGPVGNALKMIEPA